MSKTELANERRTSGQIDFDPATGLLSDRGYRKVASHISRNIRECPACRSQIGFSVAEHVHMIPGFNLQSSHTVVLVMCNACFDIRILGAVKLGIDR